MTPRTRDTTATQRRFDNLRWLIAALTPQPDGRRRYLRLLAIFAIGRAQVHPRAERVENHRSCTLHRRHRKVSRPAVVQAHCRPGAGGRLRGATESAVPG